MPTGQDFANLSPEEISVHQTVERYNIVNSFLNELGKTSGTEAKEFAKDLLLKMLPLV